jgi:TolB-like protein
MGDGALAVFESVVDAVACAAAVQRAVGDWNAARPEGERLVLRIGVNLGDVALIDGDVYGDGVNVAARLEQLCDPGGVMVSGTAFDHLQGKLGFPLEFAGQQKVKNISRPVRAYRARLDGKARQLRRARPWPLRALAAALVALLAMSGAWWWSRPSGPAGRPSIAVLPFDALGGDAATARLAEGITEEIITDLARFRAVDVIARESTRAYREQPINMAAIGRALNVRYVLDGSIQRQGDRLRVTAQLVDAANERDVWADRWERRAEDLFAVQSELAEAVASEVASAYSGAIVTAERDAAKRKPPKSLTAYDLYLLAIEARERATLEGLEQAVTLLERSLGIDPAFSRAWTALAVTYADLAEMRGYPAELQAARETAARKAVELDPADPAAHAALATVYMDQGDAGRAEAEFDKALALNPGSADLLAIYAGWASDFGLPEQGVEAAERAMRLNPAIPAWAVYNVGYAYFMAGRHGAALRMLDRLPKEAYTPATHVYRAAALGALGRTEEAKHAVAEALARNPGLSIESFASAYGSNDAQRQLLTETMRQAGFPVCASEAVLKANPGLRRLPECLTS